MAGLRDDPVPGLPPNLLEHCHRVLVQCDQFNSQESLKTIFATRELARYGSGLPDADTKFDRVQKVVYYLLPKRLIDGRPVFSLFLAELHNRQHEEDERRYQLAELCSEIDQVLSNEPIIPFIAVAMRRDEATALFKETAFSSLAVPPIERTRFQELKRELQEDAAKDLLAHYGDEREGWKPYAQNGDTIKEIVLEMTDHISQNRQGYPPIHPHFFSTDFFAEDYDTRLRTWDQLSWLGCVLIVDALSLFHPMIYRRLLESEMGSNQRVAIATALFSPIILSGSQANQLIKQEIKLRMQRAFVRSAWYWDTLCNHEIENMRNLQQWFDVVIPEAVNIVHEQKRKRRPHPTGLKWLRGEIEASRVSSLIFGQGGRQ